jgi:molybdate transport system substrate-binding protein
MDGATASTWSGRIRARSIRLVAALCALSLLAAACGDDDDDAADSATTAHAGSDLDGTVTVFAAASLTDAFDEIDAAFEEANPGVTVEANYGASSALREQILAGAPADVFASANTSNMDQVVAGGAAEDPTDFVTNVLQIAVPAGNDADVAGLDDFADPDLLIGLCAEEVPCGEFGRAALANAGITPSIDTNEPDVRSLLTKLEAGELDAGIVYVTDVMAAGDAVEGIDIPEDDNVVATYPIAPLTDAPNGEAAAAFVDFVLSDEGQEILSSYGFGAA